ncbi:MAG: hypothetical protein HY682_03530 [Chloroflexi bacterium]|nr:hypothetical protein [Chloroflexota bacterium]
MKAVIFLGPTMPAEEARRILDAVYLPPAGQADVLSAIRIHEPQVIGLIDGVFYQSPSVWHKEILYALSIGIHFYGAASMGAIRAAEMAPFGAVGIGEIYRRFAAGELEDDDEVAVAHASGEQGYRPLSEAMVNIRETLRAAVAQKAITHGSARELATIAKRLYFPNRTLDRILNAARSQGLPDRDIQAFSDFASRGFVDLKRKDAEMFLETIRDAPSTGEARPRPPFVPSVYFSVLNATDRKVPSASGDTELSWIARYAAVTHPDWHRLAVNARNRRLAALISELLEIQPSEKEISGEIEQFRRRSGLGDESEFFAWLKDNDLSPVEFHDLMATLAAGRHLHRWYRTIDPGAWARDILDELRLEHRYVQVKDEAGLTEQLARASAPGFQEQNAVPGGLDQLLAEQPTLSGLITEQDAEDWAKEAGFADREDLYVTLLAVSLARDYGLALAGLLAEIMQPQDRGAG